MATDRSKAFVDFVIEKAKAKDGKAFAARLKRASSKNTEYQSWEILSSWVDLDSERDRRAFGLVGSNIVETGISQDGKLSIGAGLRKCVDEKISSPMELAKSSPGARLKRLFACRRAVDLIELLRSALRLLASKEIHIDNSRLLDEILWFDNERGRERTCIGWAEDFYRHRSEEEK